MGLKLSWPAPWHKVGDVMGSSLGCSRVLLNLAKSGVTANDRMNFDAKVALDHLVQHRECGLEILQRSRNLGSFH